MPHHVNRRGNRRMDIFFSEVDYQEYLYVMCNGRVVQPLYSTALVSYCLMSNHVYLVVVREWRNFLVKPYGPYCAASSLNIWRKPRACG